MPKLKLRIPKETQKPDKPLIVRVNMIKRQSARKIAEITAASLAAIAAITGTGYYGHKKYKQHKAVKDEAERHRKMMLDRKNYLDAQEAKKWSIQRALGF